MLRSAANCRCQNRKLNTATGVPLPPGASDGPNPRPSAGGTPMYVNKLGEYCPTFTEIGNWPPVRVCDCSFWRNTSSTDDARRSSSYSDELTNKREIGR